MTEPPHRSGQDHDGLLHRPRMTRPTEHLVASRVKAREAGSCNFCSRQVTAHGTDYSAVVTKVWSEGSVGGICVRFCDACMEELITAWKRHA